MESNTLSVPNIAAVPTGLEFTGNSKDRKKRIKLLAESIYQPRNRRERLIARATTRRALKGTKI